MSYFQSFLLNTNIDTSILHYNRGLVNRRVYYNKCDQILNKPPHTRFPTLTTDH